MAGMSELDTAVIQIGNTDNKLTQQEWASFVAYAHEAICRHAYAIHFHGGSESFAPWQNAAWIIELLPGSDKQLKIDVSQIGRRFNQDFIAFVIGNTELVSCKANSTRPS